MSDNRKTGDGIPFQLQTYQWSDGISGDMALYRMGIWYNWGYGNCLACVEAYVPPLALQKDKTIKL